MTQYNFSAETKTKIL